MATRRLEVEFVGDVTGLERANRKLQRDIADLRKQFDDADKSGRRFGDGTDHVGKQIDSASVSARRLGDDIRNVGRDSDSTHKTVSRLAAGFGGRGLGRDIDGLTASLGPLRGGFGGLVAITATLGPVLIAAAGSAVALGAALAPLVGLAGAGAVALTAFGQAAGVVALAAMGVGDALKEQLSVQDKAAKQAASGADTQRSAARAIASAQDGVRSANEQVRAATESLGRAEKDRAEALKALGPAQRQARRDLEDMRSSFANAVLSEKQAVMGLKQAREDLADALRPVDVDKLAAAQAALTSSTRGEQRAVQDLSDARKRLADLMKPPDALSLADAQDAVADATRDETRAQLQLAKARERAQGVLDDPTATDADKAQAKLDLADAENAIGDATRNSARAQQQLAKLQAGPDPDQVAKAKRDVADAEQSVADATAETAKAQKDVKAAQAGPDPKEVAKARLAVAEAEQRVTDATRARVRIAKDLAAAEKAGVNGSEVVIAARQRIADADNAVADAERGLKEAHRAVAKATQAVRDAQTDAAASSAALAVSSAALNEKFDDLPPAAQAFVKALVALKPKLDELRATAAAGLFPGVIAGIQAASKNFEPLRRVVGETAGVLGGLAKRAGELVGSKGFGKDIQTIGHRNVLIIDRLGRAAINVGDALRHIVVAAGPLTTWLAKVALGWSEQFDAAVKAGRESGALAGFFQKTRNTLIRVASIVMNLASAFFNVGKAAAPFGRDILKTLDDVTGRFNAWTKSVGGQKSLQNFFRESNKLMAAFLPAVATILKSLGSLAFTVLPAYAAILKRLGPLAGPILQAFVVWKLAATGAAIATGLVSAATTAWTIAGKAAVGASKAWAAAQWLLNAALTANPIGIIVVAVAALVAGLILAYKKSETFRKIVNAVGDALADAAKAVYGFVTDVDAIPGKLLDAGKAIVHAIVDGVKALPGVLADGAKWLFSHIDDAIKLYLSSYTKLGGWILGGIIDGFKALPGLLGDAAKWLLTTQKKALEAIGHLFVNRGKDVIGWVTDGIRTAPGSLLNAGKWLVGVLKTAFEASLAFFTNRGQAVIAWITTGIRTAPAALLNVAGWLVDVLKTAFTGSLEFFKNRGQDVIGWITSGIRSIPDALANIGTWLVNRLKDAFKATKDAFTGLGGTLIGWIVDGLKSGLKLIAGFAKKILTVIGKIPGLGDVTDKAKTAIDTAVEKATGMARGGAFGRTGGVVNRPMVMMGEEAPSHPEFVIPTNPAYRGRAKGLLAQAANAIGFAEGGRWSVSELEGLWRRNAPSNLDNQAHTMAVVSTAESGAAGQYGYQFAMNPSGASGLWQILGQEIAGNIFNADVNAKNAVWKLQHQGLGAWAASRSMWEPLLNGGGGFLSGVVDAVKGLPGKVAGLLANGGKALLGLLPDSDSLGWMKGVGDFLLKRAGGFIKDKLAGLIGGGSGGSVSGLQPVVTRALNFARAHGWHGSVTSGFRSRAEQQQLYDLYRSGRGNKAAPPGNSNHERGLAVDVTDTEGFARAMSMMGAGALLRKVPGEPWHFSPTGFRMGGVLGSFETGTSFVPQTGPYLLHRGESVTPAGDNGRPIVLHAEFDLGRGVKQRMVLEFDEQGRQLAGAYAAGRLPA